jgi:hypothetical protein
MIATASPCGSRSVYRKKHNGAAIEKGVGGMTHVIKEIELDKLSISSRNVRKDPGDLADFIASIATMGVLAPILMVQKGEWYEVIAGSLRAEAARRAGHTTISAIVLAVIDTIRRDDTATTAVQSGVVTCAYCEYQLSLTHLSDDMHQVKQYAQQQPKDQMVLPGLFL